ncbi:MAG: DUF460 domain-containing protein [Candidatus Nanohaloarchaea archaeon]
MNNIDTDLRVVGIDPGTTTGVAALDLDGTLVDYTSRRDFAKDRIIQFMVDAGKPLIVAADVAPPPTLVEDIGSNTGSLVFAPDTDLSQNRKEALVTAFPVDGEDSHVADAVAAAEYARREYVDTVSDIHRRAVEEGVEPQLDDIIELVVNGELSTAAAISEVSKVDADEPEPAVDDEAAEPDWEDVAAKRQQRIELLESKVANLQEYIDDVDAGSDGNGVGEEELRRRNRRIRDLAGDLEQARADIEQLEAERDAFREAVQRLADGWRYVPTVDSLADADTTVVAVDRYTGEEIAADVETVMTSQASPDLRQAGVTTVAREEVDRIVETPDGYVVHPAELDTEQDAEAFMEWLEAYRTR